MEESPVPNAVASRPLCRVKECPGAQVLLSDMWFVAAYGARKFSPPSSSNSEERTLPAVCGTSCFRCSQGGTLVWRFELEPDPLSQLLTVPVFPRSLLLGALREAIPHKPCSCRVRADSGFPVLHAVSTEDSASCVPG
ncbi:uncharacterized protein LOC144110991 isoform X2 [Amblyomma americanum]